MSKTKAIIEERQLKAKASQVSEALDIISPLEDQSLTTRFFTGSPEIPIDQSISNLEELLQYFKMLKSLRQKAHTSIRTPYDNVDMEEYPLLFPEVCLLECL